jgi:uncharacterized ion transporter superfamily protein YfcC
VGEKKKKEKEKGNEEKATLKLYRAKEERDTHAVFEWTHTHSLFFCHFLFVFGVWPLPVVCGFLFGQLALLFSTWTPVQFHRDQAAF